MTTLAAGALRLAAARNDVYTMRVLSRLPSFDVDASMAGFTPLMAAVVNGHEAAVAWLLHKGASVASLKDDGWVDSVLHYAAAAGSLKVVQALLAFGANARAVNALGRTPADAAADAGHLLVANYLLAVATGRAAAPAKVDFMDVKSGSWANLQVGAALGLARSFAGLSRL
jgi:hypothetical protein